MMNELCDAKLALELPANLCVVDVESTALNPKAGELLEIGAAFPSGEPFFAVVKMPVSVEGGAVSYEFPHEQGALEVNGWTPARNDEATHGSAAEAIADFVLWLMEQRERLEAAGHTVGKMLFAGKNPQFDWDWLEANWPTDSLVELKDLFSRRRIDLHSWAYLLGVMVGVDMTAEGFTTDDLYAMVGLRPEPLPHRGLQGALCELIGFRAVLHGVVDLARNECRRQMDARDRLVTEYQREAYELGGALRERERELEQARREICLLRDELDMKDRELAGE